MSDRVVLRDLSDDELLSLTDDEVHKLSIDYQLNGIPVRNTVKGLLDELNIKYDDLTDFILGLTVGRCNFASRSGKDIRIYRKGSELRDNIVISLDDSVDVPDVTIQIQVTDAFVHEEAYNKDGLLIYTS